MALGFLITSPLGAKVWRTINDLYLHFSQQVMVKLTRRVRGAY